KRVWTFPPGCLSSALYGRHLQSAARAARGSTASARSSALAPVVEDVKFVRNRDASRLEVAERAGNVAVFHVSMGIIIGANDHNAGVPASARLDQKVQVLEIIVIP